MYVFLSVSEVQNIGAGVHTGSGHDLLFMSWSRCEQWAELSAASLKSYPPRYYRRDELSFVCM